MDNLSENNTEVDNKEIAIGVIDNLIKVTKGKLNESIKDLEKDDGIPDHVRIGQCKWYISRMAEYERTKEHINRYL